MNSQNKKLYKTSMIKNKNDFSTGLVINGIIRIL
jgi:hypothetical protein